MSQGNIREGVAAYKKAISLKPDMKEAWFNMGQVGAPRVHGQRKSEKREGVNCIPAPCPLPTPNQRVNALPFTTPVFC